MMLQLKLEGLCCTLWDGEVPCASMRFSFTDEKIVLSPAKIERTIPGLDAEDALSRTILSAALERKFQKAKLPDGGEIDIPDFFGEKSCGGD